MMVQVFQPGCTFWKGLRAPRLVFTQGKGTACLQPRACHPHAAGHSELTPTSLLEAKFLV